MLHSAAALLRLAEMEYKGATVRSFCRRLDAGAQAPVVCLSSATQPCGPYRMLVLLCCSSFGLSRKRLPSFRAPLSTHTQPPCCPSQSIFIRVLLDKKYALPYRVVDALVFHFVRTLSDNRTYPVLWHQSFLTFVQRCVFVVRARALIATRMSIERLACAKLPPWTTDLSAPVFS